MLGIQVGYDPAVDRGPTGRFLVARTTACQRQRGRGGLQSSDRSRELALPAGCKPVGRVLTDDAAGFDSQPGLHTLLPVVVWVLLPRQWIS